MVHDLPVVAAFRPGGLAVGALPSPPLTPPTKSEYMLRQVGVLDLSAPSSAPSSAPPSPTDAFSTAATSTVSCPSPSSARGVWSLAPRYGHSAMISGIRSSSTIHEQIIVGWTGDIHFADSQEEKVTADAISREDKVAYEDALKNWAPKESDPDDDKKTTYVPVWLDDRVAHGHYDGYCKQSMSNVLQAFPFLGYLTCVGF